MNGQTYDKSDPRYHTANIKRMLDELTKHLRDDVAMVNDPKAKALFEVSAEVLGGLQKAFEDYEQKNEAAWREPMATGRPKS